MKAANIQKIKNSIFSQVFVAGCKINSLLSFFITAAKILFFTAAFTGKKNFFQQKMHMLMR
ncbi:MAG: hypothetical protein J5642_03235 [Bacteroidales bacterium]|nr:hypothetical protein [Bacteroidales bacterium]